jgi:hypothetical protein
MSRFDVGGEIFVKFQFKDTEAARGEDARDAFENKIKELFGTDAYIRIERSWFQPSADSAGSTKP